MINNNYDLPKSTQLEESANNNTQNNNFFNENNIVNIDNLNNLIETLSNISDENIDSSDQKLNRFMDKLFYNDNIYKLDADTLDNFSVYKINDLNENYDEKRKKFDFKQLTTRLDLFLSRANTELSKLKNSEKINKLETQINKLKDFRNIIRKNKNNSTNKNFNKNNINELSKKFKKGKKDVLKTFPNKKTKEDDSYKINYPHHTKKNAKISKNNSQNVSNTCSKFQKIRKVITNNPIYKNLRKLFNNLKNLIMILKKKINNNIKSIKDNSQGNNEIKESYMKYYYNKLLATFQVSRGFKEFSNKVKRNNFLNNLYNKYKTKLENKNLINTICENIDSNNITLPPIFSDTEFNGIAKNNSKMLSLCGTKIKNNSKLSFPGFFYNILCLLGCVNGIVKLQILKHKKKWKL